jgi:hypothetical protein
MLPNIDASQALLSLAAAAQWQRAMELLRHGGCAVNFLSFYAVLRACEVRGLPSWVAHLGSKKVSHGES